MSIVHTWGATLRPLSLAAAALLSGCAAFGPDPEISTLGGGGHRVNSAGTHQLLDNAFETVDLVQWLAPEGLPDAVERRCRELPGADAEARAGCRIDAAFELHHAAGPAADNAQRRNTIQDRLLAAADRRCNVYLAYIQRQHAAASFTLGSLTSLLGGAGAIATGASTARALAGSAGILSGVRAEYEQSYFLNQTTNIIAAGIRTRRDTLLGEIDKLRGDAARATIERYTVERAVADAMRYNGACSLLAGLEQTSVTVNAQAGLEAALKAADTVNKYRAQAAADAASAASAAGR